MATRTSSSLKQAFKRFVELVEPIEDVRHVVAWDDGGPEIFAYITEMDDAVSKRVHEAEFQIMRDFPDLPILFHVRYLEGRPFDAHATAALTYSRHAA